METLTQCNSRPTGTEQVESIWPKYSTPVLTIYRNTSYITLGNKCLASYQNFDASFKYQNGAPDSEAIVTSPTVMLSPRIPKRQKISFKPTEGRSSYASPLVMKPHLQQELHLNLSCIVNNVLIVHQLRCPNR